MAARSDPKIYISHRRNDSAAASRLADRLMVRMGRDRVLPGVDSFAQSSWRSAIHRALISADVLLVVIGPGWRLRLDDPEDRVVTELHTAFSRDSTVIPVLVDGAAMPEARDLPASLVELANRQAARLDDVTFHADADRLIEAITQLARPDPPSPDPVRSPAPTTPTRTAFISYRRAVSWSTARLVLRDLKDHGVDAFMDVDDIDNGEFERVILTQIAARAHFIVVLEPGSLDRIGAQDDWLRREIAHAIVLERNIVPLACNGFQLDQDVVLPDDIARLRSFNAVTVPHDYFDEAMRKLRRRFLQLPETPAVTSAPPTTEGTVRAKISRALGFEPPR